MTKLIPLTAMSFWLLCSVAVADDLSPAAKKAKATIERLEEIARQKQAGVKAWRELEKQAEAILVRNVVKHNLEWLKNAMAEAKATADLWEKEIRVLEFESRPLAVTPKIVAAFLREIDRGDSLGLKEQYLDGLRIEHVLKTATSIAETRGAADYLFNIRTATRECRNVIATIRRFVKHAEQLVADKTYPPVSLAELRADVDKLRVSIRDEVLRRVSELGVDTSNFPDYGHRELDRAIRESQRKLSGVSPAARSLSPLPDDDVEEEPGREPENSRELALRRGALETQLGELKSNGTAIAKLAKSWRDEIRPLLQNDSGRRISADTRINLSFCRSFVRADAEHQEAIAIGEGATAYAEAMNQTLVAHDTYFPSQQVLDFLTGLNHEIHSVHKLFQATEVRIDIWVEASGSSFLDSITLGERVENYRRSLISVDKRHVSVVGSKAIDTRELVYEQAAKTTAEFVRLERTIRERAARIAGLKVLLGKVSFNAGEPDKRVSIRIEQPESLRSRTAFVGLLLFDDEDTIWTIGGSVARANQFFFEATNENRSLQFDGEFRDDQIVGRWSFSDEVLGTFVLDSK